MACVVADADNMNEPRASLESRSAWSFLARPYDAAGILDCMLPLAGASCSSPQTSSTKLQHTHTRLCNRTPLVARRRTQATRSSDGRTMASVWLASWNHPSKGQAHAFGTSRVGSQATMCLGSFDMSWGSLIQLQEFHAKRPETFSNVSKPASTLQGLSICT